MSLRPLREHQVRGITLLRQALASGSKRPLLMLPTGGGKTRLAAEIINGALHKSKRVVFTVPAISLVDQTAREFFVEGIRDVGVMQADHPMTDPSKPVQIASVQTLKRRVLPEADLVIVDEAHRQSDIIKEWMTKEPKLPFVGLSATPWAKGLGLWYDQLIIAATTGELIEAGHLSGFRVFAPSKPDLTKVRTVAGDWHEGDLSRVMSDKTLTADIVRTWLEKGERRPTLCFAVDLAHAKTLQIQFEASGVSCGYLDARSPAHERERVRKAFAAGEYEVVTNVGVLSTGVDWDVRCIILARPTKSEMLYCLDAETEILTADGWTGIDDIRPDQRVATWADGEVAFERPLQIIQRDRAPGERMVSVAGKFHNIRVTEDHDLLWADPSDERFAKRKASSLVGCRGFIPVSGHAAPAALEPAGVSKNTIRLRTNSLAYKYRQEGMEPAAARALAEVHQRHTLANQPKAPQDLTEDECAFIGFWMGDGTKGGGRYALAQSEAYPKIVAWVDALVARIGLHHTRDSVAAAKTSNRFVRWHLCTGRGGRDQRRDGGLAPLLPYLEKDGSPLLWGLDARQLKALLHGYWLADGNHGCGEVPSERGKQIFGTNRKAFDLLQAIAACRGIRAGIHTAERRNHYKSMHTFHWQEIERLGLVRDQLKVESDWRPERVWCVETETGTIITRRRGKVTVMGNCQIIGRGLRTAPGKSDCLILDHSDTTLRLGFVTDIHHDRLSMGAALTDNESGGQAEPPKPKECPRCHYVRAPRVPSCPSCGYVPEVVSKVETVDGELVDLTEARKANRVEDWSGKVSFMSQLKRYAQASGKSDAWCSQKYKSKFGVWPNDPRVRYAPAAKEVSPEVKSWVQAQNIRWAKSAAKRERAHA